jgi:hypothetical protein
MNDKAEQSTSSKKFLALHSPASPPDVRQGYALPEANKKYSGAMPLVRAQPLRDLNRCGFAARYDCVPPRSSRRSTARLRRPM